MPFVPTLCFIHLLQTYRTIPLGRRHFRSYPVFPSLSLSLIMMDHTQSCVFHTIDLHSYVDPFFIIFFWPSSPSPRFSISGGGRNARLNCTTSMNFLSHYRQYNWTHRYVTFLWVTIVPTCWCVHLSIDVLFTFDYAIILKMSFSQPFATPTHGNTELWKHLIESTRLQSLKINSATT